MKFIIYHMPARNYLKTAMSYPSWLWYFPKVIRVLLFMSLFFLFLFFMVFALASFPDLCIAQRNENTIFWKFSGIHFQVAKRFDDISPSCGLFESITDSSKRESFFTLSKIWSLRSGKRVIRWSTRLMLCISAPKKWLNDKLFHLKAPGALSRVVKHWVRTDIFQRS